MGLASKAATYSGPQEAEIDYPALVISYPVMITGASRHAGI